MYSETFKSIFRACWWSLGYETILSIASIMSVSHVFMLWYTRLYVNDTESIERKEAVEKLKEYRQLLEEKRDYLVLVCKELDTLSNKIDKIFRAEKQDAPLWREGKQGLRSQSPCPPTCFDR